MRKRLPKKRKKKRSKKVDPLKLLLTQLKSERKKGPPNPALIESELSKNLAEQEEIKQESLRLKLHSKKRKTEIDEWKSWYKGLLEADQHEGLSKLNAEIDWRAADIAATEKVISDLELETISLEGAVQQLRIQLAAIEHGVYDRPPEEDPRYLGLKKQLES